MSLRFGLVLAASLAVAPMVMAGAKPAVTTALAGDAVAGTDLFKKKCMACHTNGAGQPASIGPNLFGVSGRKAASTKFSYSDALKNSGLIWDKAALDKFLAAPQSLIPGTRMLIAVTDAQQRADLVEYLASLK